MFVALRSDGTQICLLSKEWTRENLEVERREEKFSCPECKAKLMLKLGYQHVWHFAHHPNSHCSLSHHGETEEHRQGKWKLVNWLIDHGYDPQIEYYLSSIKQRPDIYVVIENQPYVFELQRSSIEEEQFTKRHQHYLGVGIQPIWIGFTSTLNRVSSFLFSSHQLDHHLICFGNPPHSIYLSLESNQFFILSRFMYLSSQRIMAFPMKVPLENFLPHQLVHQQYTLTKFPDIHHYYHSFSIKWLRETKKKRLHCYYSLSVSERMMLRIFQQYHLNLNYFPALGSLPLKTNYYFSTSPQWWQSWLIIKIINETSLLEEIRLTNITEKLYFLSMKGIFHIRSLRRHKKDLIREAISEYLDTLCLFNVLKKRFPGVYLVQNHIHIRKQLNTLCMDDIYVQKKVKEVWEKEGRYFGNENKLL